MTQFKEQSTFIRAKDALAKLYELVTDTREDLVKSLAELNSMDAAEIMIELKSWRDDNAPEYQRVLRQHGF